MFERHSIGGGSHTCLGRASKKQRTFETAIRLTSPANLFPGNSRRYGARTSYRVVPGDIEAATHQALGVVPHFHPRKLERPRHLVASEQPQLDALAVVLDPVRCAAQVIVQKDR